MLTLLPNAGEHSAFHGDETSDWVAAERELLEELKAK